VEYFAFFLGNDTVALVPYPVNLTPDALAAYMANPPADVLATARRERAALFGFAAPVVDNPADAGADAPGAALPPLEADVTAAPASLEDSTPDASED
jgi:hypothetical protein